MTTTVRETTPRGAGGVSVIEVRGPRAHELLARLAKRLPDPGQFLLSTLRSDGVELEQALLVCEAPERFELHLTGSPPLVRRVLSHLGGESLPAGKSVEDRAWVAMGDAASEAGARILLDQSRGALREAIEGHVGDGPESWEKFVNGLLEAARVADAALRPRRVALAGRVNAGKSTLFNLLVGTERVVVSEEAGTTRDVVSARVCLGEWPVELYDTAGERSLESERLDVGAIRLERAGQRVGRLQRSRADLVLWLQSAVDDSSPVLDGDRLRVLNSMADRAPAGARGLSRPLSGLRDPAGARRLVAEVFGAFFRLPDSAWSPGRAVPFETDLRLRLEASLDRASGRRASVLAALDSTNPA